MATSVEGSSSGKDLRGLSSLDETNVEKSILRRGLATVGEIEACKNHRSKLATKDKRSSPSLLEVMVDAKVLTRSQVIRLLQEKGEGTRKLEIPGYQILEKLGNAMTGDYVFPSPRGRKPLSHVSLAKVMRRLQIDGATVHGFRSAFRDWAGNETHFPREVAEAALAHVIGDKAEQAYRRGDALEKRRALMEAWAGYCEPKQGGNIVPIKRRGA